MDEIPEDEIGDILSDLGELGEEAIGLGPIRRIYNILKKRIARQYIAEIRILRRKQDILLSSIQSQTELNGKLRNYISQLERRIEELEGREHEESPPGP